MKCQEQKGTIAWIQLSPEKVVWWWDIRNKEGEREEEGFCKKINKKRRRRAHPSYKANLGDYGRDSMGEGCVILKLLLWVWPLAQKI
jgi:hypothetical protein